MLEKYTGPEINLCGAVLTPRTLDIALRRLAVNGEVRIYNCGGVNALELGAYLESIANQRINDKISIGDTKP